MVAGFQEHAPVTTAMGLILLLTGFMFRGLGRVEHALLAAFRARPDHVFTTEELCEVVYPKKTWPKWAITKAQRVAVLRAARKVAQTAIEWRSIQSDTRGGHAVWYNATSVRSYSFARALGDFLYRGDAERAARALEAGGRLHKCITEGGVWRKDVDSFRREIEAIRCGDKERLKAVLEERKVETWRRLRALGIGTKEPPMRVASP